jgi:hypothetical protein
MFRRVGERAGAAAQTASAAAPDAVAQTMTATATAAPAATGLSERLVAAGVTILVAGSVTVGAAKIVNERAQPVQEEVAAAAALVVPDTSTSQLEVPDVAKPESILQGPKRDRVEEPETVEPDPTETTDPVVVAPAEETTPPESAPSPGPTTPPGTQPNPPPTQSPSPPVPPQPPEFKFLFTSSTTSTETCTCPDVPPDGSNFDRSGDSFKFSQSVHGGALDAEGDRTWPFSLAMYGQGNASSGGLNFTFTLDSESGQSTYGGSAPLVGPTPLDDGAMMYSFEGDFRPINSQPGPGLPLRGRVSITLSVWRDGTIYFGSLALTEAPA